jgi:hypothetical protein
MYYTVIILFKIHVCVTFKTKIKIKIIFLLLILSMDDIIQLIHYLYLFIVKIQLIMQ